MADISLTTAARVEVVLMDEAVEGICQEDITAGAPITIVPSSTGAGKFVNSDANSGTAALKTVKAIATRTAKAGEALTGMKRGIMSGFTFTDQAYHLPIYVSDTVGRLADAASATTVLPVGRVEPAYSNLAGTSPDKYLRVDISDLPDAVV
jgi:hypothetical protein